MRPATYKRIRICVWAHVPAASGRFEPPAPPYLLTRSLPRYPVSPRVPCPPRLTGPPRSLGRHRAPASPSVPDSCLRSASSLLRAGRPSIRGHRQRPHVPPPGSHVGCASRSPSGGLFLSVINRARLKLTPPSGNPILPLCAPHPYSHPSTLPDALRAPFRPFLALWTRQGHSRITGVQPLRTWPFPTGLPALVRGYHALTGYPGDTVDRKPQEALDILLTKKRVRSCGRWQRGGAYWLHERRQSSPGRHKRGSDARPFPRPRCFQPRIPRAPYGLLGGSHAEYTRRASYRRSSF